MKHLLMLFCAAIGLSMVLSQAASSKATFVAAKEATLSSARTSTHAPVAGSMRLAYGCNAGQCTCHGDDDCNNMYSGGACKQTGSCETAGGVACTCATQAKTNTQTGGGGKVVVKKPPELLKKHAAVKTTVKTTVKNTVEKKPTTQKKPEQPTSH